MGTGDEMLTEDLESAIRTIETTPDSTGTCPSHRGISTGVLVLLRCKRLEMRSYMHDRARAKRGKWLTGVIAAGVAAGTVPLVKLLERLIQ